MSSPLPSPRRALLFVDAPSALAQAAESALRAFLDARRTLHVGLEIHAVRDDVRLAMRHRVIATPCLILLDGDVAPRKLIGDLNDETLLEKFFGHGGPAPGPARRAGAAP